MTLLFLWAQTMQAKVQASKKLAICDTLYFHSYDYKSLAVPVSDLLKEQDINIELEKIPCTPRIDCDQEIPETFIFIGKRKKITQNEEQSHCDGYVSMDAGFSANYEVIEKLYGIYPSPQIEFTVYDHYGLPYFANYETVLLYLNKYCGKYYHIKYRFQIYI